MALPLPHPGNTLEDDVLRLRTALQGIDTVLHDLATGLAGAATAAAVAAALATLGQNITDLQTAINSKQATLVSGQNIKTINGASLLGSTDLQLQPKAYPVNSINAATTAQAFQAYELLATLDLTLPAAPNTGDWVLVLDRSGAKASRVLRNGRLIEGTATDLNLNVLNRAFFLIYTGATNGWRVVLP